MVVFAFPFTTRPSLVGIATTASYIQVSLGIKKV